MHKYARGCFAAAKVQHGRPKQGVEGDDVFANEMVLLNIGVVDVLLKVLPLFAQQVFKTCQIAYGRIKPDVEVFAGRVGDFYAEIGRVARNVPVAQLCFAFFIGCEPFADFVEHFGLHVGHASAGLRCRPALQKLHSAWGRQGKEEMLAAFEHGRGSTQGRVGLVQLGGAVNGAAHFAVIAILVGSAAFGALPFDETVGQEHAFFGVVKLLDDAAFNQASGFEVAVDGLCQLGVFWAIGAVPVVKTDVKAIQILFAPCGNVCHKLLRGFACFFGSNHDGCAVGIVSTHKFHIVALHALKAHPNVGLDVFHDVADVKSTVGVGQGSGDEKLACHGYGQW